VQPHRVTDVARNIVRNVAPCIRVLKQEWTRIELLDNKTDLNKNILVTRLKIRHLLSENHDAV